MKVRTDFVTNSSSSSYLITLTIVNTDVASLEFSGCIDETSGGYLSNSGEVDPRMLANASNVDELKQFLSSFQTLSDSGFCIMNDNGDIEYEWSGFDIPGCPEDEDEAEDWIFDIEREEGIEEYVFQAYLSSLDERVQSMDNVKSISVKCEGESFNSSDLPTKVIEEYTYDKTTENFTSDYSAVEEGEDVTDMMLNHHYSIDCGDDCLVFQLELEK